MRTRLARLTRMGGREFLWRGRTAARTTFDRARTSIKASHWNRGRLVRSLAHTAALAAARDALADGRWMDGHRALTTLIATSPARFPVAPAMRPPLAKRIRADFPAGACDARRSAQRIVEGQYDLLGYTGLRFGTGTAIDWHRDPVHDRSAPRAFWSTVAFLSPEYGDHKVIWEINRHQHWLALGRAFWLTDERIYRDTMVGQLASWLAANPPLIGVNWASMLELAFRSMSWTWTLHLFAATGREDDHEPWSVDLLLALDRQFAQIERHLSYYFSPNTHLIGEALALFVGGLALPWLAGSERRVSLGRRVLLSEISRQIAADGGHCERSTHYHRYTLDFYLLALIVARINSDPAAPAFTAAVERLAVAARLLADDYGRAAHFGDDDGGAAFKMTDRAPDDLTDSLEIAATLVDRPDLHVGAPTEEALWLLAHPMFAGAHRALAKAPSGMVPGSASLPETGYYVSRARGVHLVADAGPHGYQNGGHAHADALSMTLTLRSIPLLIDPGTHCYTIAPVLRDRMRSTALHNTLTLDGRSASIPAGPFHWAHTASCNVHRWRMNRAFDYLDASHDGYAPASHRRRVLAVHDDLIVVLDLVAGSGVRRADVHWHFNPRWVVDVDRHKAAAAAGDERVDIVVPAGRVQRFSADPVTGLGWHAPVYGALEPATTLRITRRARAPFWIVTVFGLRADNPVEGARIVPLRAVAGALEHSIALTITRARTIEHVVVAEARGPSRTEVWRACGIEADAAMALFRVPRQATDGHVCVGMVDGSRVRGVEGTPFSVELPAVADTYFDAVMIGADRWRPHVRDRRVR